MNISNFVTELSKKQSQVTDPLEFALLGKAIEQLKISKVFFVKFQDELPSASSVQQGTLYYVRFEKALYYASSLNRWINLSYLNISNVYGFGSGTSGKLGNNCLNEFSSPAILYSNFTDWCQVSARQSHSAAVRTNCTLWTWGGGLCGALGDNSISNKSSPVSVVGGFTDWCQVSAGSVHTAAVRTNGTLWTWGLGSVGRLGDNTVANKSSPVSVVGGFTDWRQVSAGGSHTVALRQNGTLWAWGNNLTGRLGDGTTVDKSSPVSVIGGFTDWCQVSTFDAHTAAVRTNGTLWTWGSGSCGVLGDGTTSAKSSPVAVVGGFTDWCQVSVGYIHMAALRQNGTLWTWGCGLCGRLGDGTTVDKSSPVSVIGGFTDWCQVSAGAETTAAVRTNGTLWTWGLNSQGQLGDGTTVAKCSPVSVVGEFNDWCRVSAGTAHTIAIRNRV